MIKTMLNVLVLYSCVIIFIHISLMSISVKCTLLSLMLLDHLEKKIELSKRLDYAMCMYPELSKRLDYAMCM